jgi:hypothetical protein
MRTVYGHLIAHKNQATASVMDTIFEKEAP